MLDEGKMDQIVEVLSEDRLGQLAGQNFNYI